MRSLVAVLGTTLLLLSASGTASAKALREALLVSTAWLAERLDDPDLVLLHVGDKDEYARAHIRGARLVSLHDVSLSDSSLFGTDLTLEMPPPETLRERLIALGISEKSRVVVSFGRDRIQSATRIIFTLDYAGLGDRVSLLDGGEAAWVREGRAMTSAIPRIQAGRLPPLKVRPMVVTKEFVRGVTRSSGHAVVDTRHVAFFDGTRSGGSMLRPHRTGHIRGAASFPFTEVTDAQGMLRSPAELKARFERAGVRPGDTVLAYCHLGQQATAVLFAARTLGYKVLLYDGSFEDWTRFPDYPVESGAASTQ